MSDNGLSRRDFVRLAALGVGVAACPIGRAALAGEKDAKARAGLSDHEALAYTKLADKKVRCELCPRTCTVPDGARGYCGVRENQGGVYRSLVYAYPCSVHVDPIEKKPLFHFMPGSQAFSLATVGCNFECQFCQNWQISQARPEDAEGATYCPPAKIVELTKASKCEIIAYTYTEPTVFHEYVLDCARAGKEAGIRSVVISNGFINPEPLKNLCKVLAAYKVDLKGFTEQFYQKYTTGSLKPVLDTLELLKKLGMHSEVVNLLIPGLNDDPEQIKKMAGWVVQKLGPDVPMHFTRFHPSYKMTNLSPTPIPTIERARQMAVAEGVRYAYTGNVPGSEYENTFCHNCKKKIISRYGCETTAIHVKDGRCEYCSTAIPGVWK